MIGLLEDALAFKNLCDEYSEQYKKRDDEEQQILYLGEEE